MVLTKLEQIMNERNLAIDEISRKSGISKRTIYNIINRKGCTRNNAIKVAKGLKLTLEQLI